MNSDVVKFHESKLLNDANELLPETQKISIKFSNGWMERFKKRFGLKFQRVHGEALSADQAAIARQMLRLALLIVTYAARDV